LRVPHPDDEHPDATTHWAYGGLVEGSVVLDSRAVFTTATVLAAIHSGSTPVPGYQPADTIA
jgi:hypothetical protein